MKCDWGFFFKWHGDITGNQRFTAEFHLSDGRLAARISDSDAPDLGVSLTHRFQYPALSSENLIFIRVAQLAQNGVLLTNLVTAACQVDHFLISKLGGVGSLQPAGYKLAVRKGLAHEPSTIDIGMRRSVDPYHGKASTGFLRRSLVASCRIRLLCHCR